MADEKPAPQYQYKYASEDDSGLVAAKKELKEKDKELGKKDKQIKELESDVWLYRVLLLVLLFIVFTPANISSLILTIGLFVGLPIGLILTGHKKLVKKHTTAKIDKGPFNKLITGVVLGTLAITLIISISVRTHDPSGECGGVWYTEVACQFDGWLERILDTFRGIRVICPECEKCKECPTCPTCPPEQIKSAQPIKRTAPEPKTCPQVDQTTCTLGITTDCPNCTITELAPKPPLKPQPKSACDPNKDGANCPIPQITTDQPLTRETPKDIQYDLDKLPDHSRFIAPCNEAGGC